MRLFVGDIQGCADELDDLLRAARFDPGRDTLRPIGDLVNRGPRSLDALRILRDLDAEAVLGNHDLHLLGIAAGEREARADDTLEEILAAPDRDELLGWLRRQPLLREDDDLIQVHAGLSPRWEDPAAVARRLEAEISSGTIPWGDEDLAFLTRVRHCDERGNRQGDDLRPWDEFYRGERVVVCGHWAARGLTVTPVLRSLDGGCVWGGHLVGWIPEKDRLVAVPARRRYQSPELSSGNRA